MKHILVTGGAGFIGSHLVERLLNDGKRVVVIDDLSTGRLENLRAVKSNPRLRIVKSKISECKELPKLAANAELVFHLAATVGVELVVKSALHVLEASFQETQILLRAAAANRTPLLLTSTSEVYGKSAKPAFGEDDDLLIGPPGQSRWSYAVLEAHGRISRAGLRARKKSARHHRAAVQHRRPAPDRTLRHGAAALHRVGEKGRTVESFRRRRTNTLLLSGGRRGGSISAVAKAAQASRLRTQTPARAAPGQSVLGEIFNIGGTEEISILELARLVVKTLRSKSKIKLIPYDKAYPCAGL